jgi:hypothetical protein
LKRLGRFLGRLEAFLWRLGHLLGRLGASGVQFLNDFGAFSFQKPLKKHGKTRISRTFDFFLFMHFKTHFEPILDRSGAYLGHWGALLRRPESILRPSWGAMGIPWGLLEHVLGTFVGLMGPLGARWGVLEHLRHFFWRSWMDLASFWST